jgi:hypothetical protein
MSNETLRRRPCSLHEESPATDTPHPSPIASSLSSLLDGLEVLDPHQSSTRRASRRRDAFIEAAEHSVSKLIKQIIPEQTHLCVKRLESIHRCTPRYLLSASTETGPRDRIPPQRSCSRHAPLETWIIRELSRTSTHKIINA